MESQPQPPHRPIEALRARSWEMELLLSGFVLVLLLPLPTYVEEEGVFLLIDVEFGIVQQFLTICYLAAVFGSRILIINLIVYLFLRGFWIGMIGLATAFPQGVDFEKLRYQTRFRQYLTTRIRSADQTVQRLDQVCSSVFSFSFLAIFLILTFFILLFVIVCVLIPLNELAEPYPEEHWLAQIVEVVQIVVASIILLLAGTVLIDFLSLGLLKRIKKKWFISLYFPVYRAFRIITLAPLYAPIYYTLISNVPKRIIALLLLIYFGLFTFANTYEYDDESFFPREASRYEMVPRYYEEYYDKKRPTVYPLIPSEYTEENHLRLFIPYSVDSNDSLKARCPNVTLFEQGLQGNFFINFDSGEEYTTEADSVRYTDENVAAVLQCMASFYRIMIDNTPYRQPVFYFHRRRDNGQAGIVTYLPIQTLSSGPHLLTVDVEYDTDSTDDSSTIYIPFVKE